MSQVQEVEYGRELEKHVVKEANIQSKMEKKWTHTLPTS